MRAKEDEMIRTPKEWNETCSACLGAGKVHKREQFSLLTPDEYAGLFGPDYPPVKLDPKHDVPSNAVICWVGGSASIFEACKEGSQRLRAKEDT
jgi:hypothetical protein